jgi:hypothetical protein
MFRGKGRSVITTKKVLDDILYYSLTGICEYEYELNESWHDILVQDIKTIDNHLSDFNIKNSFVKINLVDVKDVVAELECQS